MKTNTVRKAVAVIAYAVSILTAMGGIGGTIALAEMGCYTESLSEFERNNMQKNLFSDIENLNADFENLKSEGYFDEDTPEQRKQALYNDFMRRYDETRTNFFFQVYDSEDNLLIQSYQADYDLFRTETYYDSNRTEEEKIMTEAEYNKMMRDAPPDDCFSQQIIVPHGDPAPTLPNEENEPETEPITEPITEQITEPVTEQATEFPTEPQPETESLSEPVTEPPEEENHDSVGLVAHAEDNLVYVSEYSVEEQISIANALNLDYEEDGENVWVYYNDSRIPFAEYFQNLVSQLSDFDIVTQDGWHYVIDKNQTPPQLMDIADYIMNYPEKFEPVENTVSISEEVPQNYDFYYDVIIYHTENPVNHYITGYVKKNLTAEDNYYTNHKYSSLAYRFRYAVPAVGIVSCILWLISLIYLIRSAGYHQNEEDARASVFEKIPFDLFTVVLAFLCLMSLIGADEIAGYQGTAMTVLLVCGCALLWGLVLLWWLMSLAVRIRTGTIWRNNLITKILIFLKHLFGKAKEKNSEMLRMIPFVWKAGLIALGYLFLDFSSLVLIANSSPFGVILKGFLTLAVISGTVVTVYQLHLLQEGGQKLADGHLDEKIPEQKFFLSFRKHAENLNSISDGMNKAVSERLKSETFRTELIANVSHDIRTPLTSIINYTDLLSKLEIQDETAQEYIEVLARQSARLRKLTEDVLEASKASTGSMKVEKMPMDLQVLLQQIEGEFAEKFESRNLEFISTLPESPLMMRTVVCYGARLITCSIISSNTQCRIQESI